MAVESKDLNTRLERLERRVAALSQPLRGCGMLSSTDFRERVITRESPSDYARFRDLFENRGWGELEAEGKGKGFIIDPYDELNLTPFSYDLSLGDEIFSARKRDRLRKRLPYKCEPGETVILLTREFIALPKCYSATVWPRFNLVRDGIFQSMVKIDPTWYGHLGVAVTNLSPRIVELREGMAFGTLVLYELSRETDIDLQPPERLREIRVDIPDLPIRAKLDERLGELKLKSVCWVEGNQLIVRGLKRSSYEQLLSIDTSEPWRKVCAEARSKWLELADAVTKRKSIGMEALGMVSLEKLVEGAPRGDPVQSEDVKTQIVSQDALYEMAVEYGKPFDLVSNIPKLVAAKVDEVVQLRLEGEMGKNIIPRTIALMFSILGFISLIVAVVGLLLRFFVGQSSFVSETVWMVALLIAVGFIGLVLLLAVKTGFSLRHSPDFVENLRTEISKIRSDFERRLEDCRRSCK